MKKELLTINFSRGNLDDALRQAQVLLFLCGMMEAAFIFLVAHKTNVVDEAILIISAIASVIFFTLAFIVRKNSYKIILAGIILYSALLIFNAIINYTTIFQGVIAKVFIYVGLISALLKIKKIKIQTE
jgi:hypothetical protein